MSVFAGYAKYYDLLYKDKDYTAEADYVAERLHRYGTDVRSVLELGCGTGAHASLLAQRGFTVYGVDMSDGMLASAEKRRADLGLPTSAELTFALGDARTVRLGRTFDAVISLFHVFSYQVSNEDLRGAFDTARAHLRPGGVLLFDCWYGPAVLTIGPTIKVRRLSDADIEVTRIAEPALDVIANAVVVNYDVIVMDKSDNSMHRLSESHRMRYMFVPEIREMCVNAGLEFVDAFEWMGTGPPTSSTWAACFVARG